MQHRAAHGLRPGSGREGVDGLAGTCTASGSTSTYQWLANGSAIAGATRATYTPQVADVGKRLSVRVTGAKASHSSRTATSAQTAVVPQPAIANPTRPKVSEKEVVVGKKLQGEAGLLDCRARCR